MGDESVKKVKHFCGGEVIGCRCAEFQELREAHVDWLADTKLSREEKLARFEQLNPAPTRGPAEEVRVTSSTGGQKGKKLARYDLIPGGALHQLAELYGLGAGKYEDRNWERGYEWSLSFAALQRHIWAFWRGEDIDEEMGMPHVACAIFHAMALLEFMRTHPEFDDRPGGGKA